MHLFVNKLKIMGNECMRRKEFKMNQQFVKEKTNIKKMNKSNEKIFYKINTRSKLMKTLIKNKFLIKSKLYKNKTVYKTRLKLKKLKLILIETKDDDDDLDESLIKSSVSNYKRQLSKTQSKKSETVYQAKIDPKLIMKRFDNRPLVNSKIFIQNIPTKSFVNLSNYNNQQAKSLINEYKLKSIISSLTKNRNESPISEKITEQIAKLFDNIQLLIEKRRKLKSDKIENLNKNRKTITERHLFERL